MPIFKGNKGNLLQHWVLCELTLLLKAQLQPSSRLSLVDAHAMSPYSTRDASAGASAHVFEKVRAGLPGKNSAYERAWCDLSGQASQSKVNYPTTAMLVRHLWPGPVSMVLCDIDEPTIAQITRWKQDVRDADTIVPHHDDWRQRLRQSLPTASATLVSFDPYMILHENTVTLDRGNMNLSDLVQAAAALCHLPPGPAVVQLSTYSARNSSQDDLLPVVEWIMRAVGFELIDTVRAGRDSRDMMSIVCGRGLVGPPSHLNERFNTWLDHAG